MFVGFVLGGLKPCLVGLSHKTVVGFHAHLLVSFRMQGAIGMKNRVRPWVRMFAAGPARDEL